MPKKTTTMIGYKGFDKDLKCRNDMQYEVGKEFTHDGNVKLCGSGLHFCENPLEVFDYYNPAESRYCLVKASGVTDETSSGSKRAAKTLKVEAEIGINGLVSAAVKFVLDKVDNTKSVNEDFSHATNTGYRSAAANTGYRSAAANTGYRSAATNTGYQSAATNTGDYSAATNTGDRSAATNTGYQSAATNTGYRSAAANTGYQSAATNTGDYSAATNTGDYSAATVDGKDSIAIVTGYDSKARGSKGCWIVLTERKDYEDDFEIKKVKAVKVDGKKIKADTFYKLVDGKVVEA